MSITELMTPNATLLAMLGIFLASAWVLNHFVFQPTLAVLAERKKRTTGLARDAKFFEEKSAEKLREYESLMEKALASARAKRAQILTSAQDEKRRILDAARTQTEEKLQGIKQQIAIESKEAALKLRSTARELADDMVKILLRRKAA